MEQALVGNRGQGSLEYLTNYGWAIIIIIAAGAALWQMGYLHSWTSNPDIEGEGFTRFEFDDTRSSITYAYGSGCWFDLFFHNKVGRKIAIQEFWIRTGTSGAWNEYISFNPDYPMFEKKVFGPDESIRAKSHRSSPTPCPPEVAEYISYGGDEPPIPYSVDINITYVTFGSELPHTDKGTIHGIWYEEVE